MNFISHIARAACVSAFLIGTYGICHGMGKPVASSKPMPVKLITPVPEKAVAPVPGKAVAPVPGKEVAPILKRPVARVPGKQVMPGPKKAAVPVNPSKVVVKVNDKEITEGQVMEKTAKIEKMMRAKGSADDEIQAMMPLFRPRIVAALVTETLINTECKRKKIKVSDDEIDKEIENLKSSLPKNISLQSLMERGEMTREMFRDEVVKQLKLEKLLKITQPTDKEIKAYYNKNKEKLYRMPETVRARHILIETLETDDAATKAKKKKTAGEIRNKIVAGADFAKLAEENSSCPSAKDGGDLGEFPRGQMTAVFENAVFSLKTNGISPVVETEFGFHIIQMLEHNSPRTLPYDEVKGRITMGLKGKQLGEQIIPLIESLKAKSKITYMDKNLLPPSRTKKFPPRFPG